MKRIAIDAHMLGDRSGGNESYYINLINHLKIDTNCFELYLFLNSNYDISNIRVPFKKIFFHTKNSIIRNFIEIPYLVKKWKIDVLHMQYFIPFINFCPVVVSIHDICFEHFNNIFTKKERFVQKHLIPYAARHSNAILTISKFSKEDICTCYGINPKKITITYCGVNSLFKVTSYSSVEKEIFFEKLGIPEKFILCVGNLQPRKNIDRLLTAYAELRKGGVIGLPKLVFVGKKAWLFSPIFEKIETYGISEDVVFTDYVSETELIFLYNSAQMFIYPSIFEGFGLPSLEAMACGTPVLTSNVSAIPEVVADAAEMFDPYDVESIKKSIKKMVEHRVDIQKMRNQGLLRAKLFSWDFAAAEAMSVYKKLLEKPNEFKENF